MRYMLLIYRNENATRTPEHTAAIVNQVHTVIDEMTRRGVLVGVDPLEFTTAASTVRKRDGKTIITDGPFAETKEQLGGYYIIDCKDMDEALEWAARIPHCSPDGCVEVRPIAELPKPQPADASAYAKA